MTHTEIEAIARAVYPNPDEFRPGDRCITDYNSIKALCDYILSGDHKREIENAAFRRALSRITNGTCDSLSEAEDRIRALVVHASDCAMNNAPALPAGPCDCGALIQPPAQKENGG